jgi:hypothetical protein
MAESVKSVASFLDRCLSLLFNRDDTVLFFRGVTHEVATPHIPGVYYPQHKFYMNEATIFDEIISVFPDELLAHKMTVEKLIFMQHYGFPTRILDISKNPLSALFFACFSEAGKDDRMKDNGIVYVYAVPRQEIAYCDSDRVTILANLCKMPSNFSVTELDTMAKKAFNNDYQIKNLLHFIHDDKPGFLPVIQKEDINSVVCLRPRMNNPRIVRQDGSFFLFGINGDKSRCAALNKDWIKSPITIPHRAKERILAELDQMDYTEGFFYPDFEHINHIIRKRFSNLTSVRF